MTYVGMYANSVGTLGGTMLRKLAILLVAGSFLLTAKADTFVASSAVNTSNDSISQGLTNAGPTQNISPNPTWAPALPGSNWVSFADTGNPSDLGFYAVTPNGTSVTFAQTFTLYGPAYGGSLTVMADDTTSVALDGTTLFSANLGGSYPNCSNVPIGCLTTTAKTIDLTPYIGLFNANSTNTLSFQVYQEAGSSFGLDYAGTISTPEPGMLAMLVLGLAALFIVGRRTFAASFAG
jgi:hypothetical protein